MGIIKKIFLFSLIVLISSSFRSCEGIVYQIQDGLGRDHILRTLIELEPEAEIIPAHHHFSVVYLQENSFICTAIVQEEMNISGKDKDEIDIVDVYVNYDERVYFMVAEDLHPGERWYLCSVNLLGEEFTIHYSDEFCTSEGSSKGYGHFTWSELDHDKQLKDVSGFYHEGFIVFTDKDRLIEYDLINGKSKEYAYNDYIYPELPSVRIENFEEIFVTMNGNEYSLNLQEAAESSEAFKSILSLRNAKRYFKDIDPLGRLFMRVRYIDGEFYLYCQVKGSWDNKFSLFFRYIPEEDKLVYLYLDDPHGVDVFCGYDILPSIYSEPLKNLNN